MRVFTIVNLLLWAALFVAWVPYTLATGLADPVSQQVMVILAVTAVLMLFLAAYRIGRRRPLLG